MFVYENYPDLADFLIPMHHTNVRYQLHLHACLEAHFCVCGEIAMTIGGQSFVLRENEAVIIPPHTLHSYHTESVSDSYTILISPNMIQDFANLFQQHVPSRYIFPMDAQLCRQLLDFFASNKTIFGGKSLLYRTCDAFMASNTFLEKKNNTDEIAVQIIEYIQKNFRENLSLEDFTRQVDYSYFYISKVIKKSFGLSFTQLLAQYRVSYARQLLDSRACSITEAALASGFGSIRSFNRVFLQLTGLSPREYLKHPELQTQTYFLKAEPV